MSCDIIKTLAKIIRGEEDFCCLCFSYDENIIYIHDLVEFDGSATWGEVLQSFLGKEECSLLSTNIICTTCRTSALNCYKFTKTCKENTENLSKAIVSITESFENLVENFTSFDSLYVTLNTDDFTSQQFYNVQKSELKGEVVNEQFDNVIENNKYSKEIKENSYIVLEMNTNIPKKQKKRRDVDYDIQSIPTQHITVKTINPNIYKCRVCSKVYREEKLIRSHYFKNHQPRNVKCSKCPKRFISKDILQAHEEYYHNEKVCSQCGKHFSNKYVLEKHEFNHNFKLMCQSCGRLYRSKEAFHKHLHDNICSQKMKKTSRQGTYECDYCHKKFCIKPYLAKHIKYEHENAVGYKCKFCNKNFYTPSRLESHLVKHTLEKKFKCEECGGCFVSKTSLLYHTRLHTGEKPYECEYCEKAFLSASRRLDHVRRHHLPPSLECDICKAIFKGTGTLLRHKKRHFNPNSRLSTERPLNMDRYRLGRAISRNQATTAPVLREEIEYGYAEGSHKGIIQSISD